MPVDVQEIVYTIEVQEVPAPEVEVTTPGPQGGGGIPDGGDEGDLLEKLGPEDGNAGWGAFPFVGFSQRLNTMLNFSSLREFIYWFADITYTAPTISLSASGNVLREKGDAVTSTTLTANITKRSDPIQEVRFYRNPSTLLDTQTSGGAIPGGGSSTYAWTGSFTDTTTFRAEVDDDGTSGGPTTVSATTTFNFVYPYFWGSDSSSSLTAAQVAAKTKDIRNSSASVERTYLVSGGGYFYFAQPASYPQITQIFDANNFDVTGSWTSFTGNYTALDGSTQSLRVYRILSEQGADAYFRFVR